MLTFRRVALFEMKLIINSQIYLQLVFSTHLLLTIRKYFYLRNLWEQWRGRQKFTLIDEEVIMWGRVGRGIPSKWKPLETAESNCRLGQSACWAIKKFRRVLPVYMYTLRQLTDFLKYQLFLSLYWHKGTTKAKTQIVWSSHSKNCLSAFATQKVIQVKNQ